MLLMATLKEFKALMYDNETVGDMASVIAPHCHSDEQALIMENCGKHPFNVMRLEYPPENCEGNKYFNTAETLKNWMETGVVKLEENPAFYIYEQEFQVCEKTVITRGLIGKVKIEEGVMYPHEDTTASLYSEYRSDRYNLMSNTKAVFSSVFSLYKDDNGAVARALDTKEAPNYEFSDNQGVTHRIWVVSDENEQNRIKEAFADKKLVIADGHVRYEIAVNYYKKMRDSVVEYSGEEEFNYVMMNLMPVTENYPVVKPVHRLIKNRITFNEEDIIAKLQSKFEIFKNYIREYDCDKIISRLTECRDKRAIGFYTGKDYYYLLVPNSETVKKAKSDSEMLHREIFAEIFNINKENFKSYVEYGRSVEECERKVREGAANCAFYLNPMRQSEIYGLAECGTKVPKRTNCFYPALMTGILMNKFDE